MKNPILIITICLLGANSISQELISESYIETEILSKNNFDISIIQLFPQDFPKVSVVFQAKNELGEPLWLLQKRDFLVRENSYECEVLDVRNISENRPLNLALVFDHSGSMVLNPEHMTDTSLSYELLYYQGMLPKGYVMSIEYAQEAVLNFFNIEKLAQDSLFFVGFSETVDKIAPLSNDFDRFTSIVKNVKPGGSTAFFDAVYNAIDSLKNHESQPAVIALTDGGDNSSLHTYNELIEFAKANNVPIYIIGLGNVNSTILEFICAETNGFYYHTKDPSKLTEIYENIKKQLRSIYELDYMSNEDNSDDALRRIKFYFTNDTLTFNDNEFEFELPLEVTQHLEKRHDELRKKQQELMEQEEFENNLLVGGSIAGVLLLGVGTFFIIRRKRKKNEPELINIFPNPCTDKLTVKYSLAQYSSAMLFITNSLGAIVQELEINSLNSEITLSLDFLESGIYMVIIKTDDKNSNTLKLVKN